MKIAVTYENGQVFQHFGHCAQFKLYDVADGSVTAAQVVSAAGICGGIGAGARTALAEAGIQLYPGVSGGADESVAALLKGTLSYDPDTQCAHHHEEGHQCRSGSCGEDKHGCSGNQ